MNRRAQGAIAEQEAVGYLSGLGYTMVCRNYRTRFGEIDVIATDGSVLAFVEIRSRSGTHLVLAPEESVLYNWKRQKIARAARCYLIEYPTSLPCRFDVLGVVRRFFEDPPKYRLIKDAFRVQG